VLGTWVQNGDVPDPLLVQEPLELEVDEAGGEAVRVEARATVFDLGGPRRLRERLGEPARVVGDPALSYRCQTITSPS
jgi:hypothetical protein